MKRVPGFFVITAIFLISCNRGQYDDIETWTVAATDPILAVGHGAIINAEGNNIDPLPEFVIEAQRFYLKGLYQQANEQQRAEFKATQRRLEDVSRTRAERILVNAALLARLIETVKPQDAPFLASKNTALLGRFTRITDGEPSTKDPRAGDIRKEIVERLGREGLLTFLSATQAGGPAYIEECRKAGVPIPPDWGSSQWKSKGLLTTDFLGSTPQAEVFAFERESPLGVCMALPRSTGNTIKLLGIICLGTDSSKSCFWDNQRNKQQFDIQKNTPVPLSEFAGGADLYGGSGNVCTDCHAGENPFIVHPGQPMDLGNKIIPKTWSEPLVHPNWPQNAGPTNVLQGITLNPGEDSCLGCHDRPPGRRFPEVSTAIPQYCSIILPRAISKTMPPTSPGNNASYTKHKDALLAACKQPPSGGGVVINGATQSTPQGGRVEVTGNLTTCQPGSPDCPPGFCYFETLHGPFWQKTPITTPYTDPAFRGSAARIYGENGLWKYAFVSDTTGMAPNAPPGGTMRCIAYPQIVGVPDASKCFAKQTAVVDPDGTNLSQTVDATVTGAASANVLSGFVGNVAQANENVDRPDTLRVFESGGKIVLAQNHSANPPSPLKPGPLTGESWTNGCNAWTPIYDAKDVLSTSDVQLVPPAQANNVRCYITGITGAWSSTRNNGTVQPFAEIYKGPTGDVRLRVSPIGENDRVGAFASCIRIK
jgi:hypothetical protein